MKNVSRLFLGAFIGVFATLALVIGIGSASAAYKGGGYGYMANSGNYPAYNQQTSYGMGPGMMYGYDNADQAEESHYPAGNGNYGGYNYEMGSGMMGGGGC